MNESTQKPYARRSRIFPKIQILKEELARRTAEEATVNYQAGILTRLRLAS